MRYPVLFLWLLLAGGVSATEYSTYVNITDPNMKIGLSSDRHSIAFVDRVIKSTPCEQGNPDVCISSGKFGFLFAIPELGECFYNEVISGTDIMPLERKNIYVNEGVVSVLVLNRVLDSHAEYYYYSAQTGLLMWEIRDFKEKRSAFYMLEGHKGYGVQAGKNALVCNVRDHKL